MPKKEVVFIQHSRPDGRLSQQDASKIWGHVSRTTWQEPSKQLTIKMWAPKPGEHVIQEETVVNTEIVSYNRFQQAYESTTLRHIQPPQRFVSLETIFFTAYNYTSVSRTLRDSIDGTRSDHAKTDPWKAFANFTLAQFCVGLGLSNLEYPGQNMTQAFACFELASQLITRCLTRNLIDYLPNILGVLDILGKSQSQHAHDVVRLFLQQINALASLHGGSMHPLALCTKTLLALEHITPEVVEEVGTIRTNMNSDPDPSTLEVNHFILKCEVRGIRYPLDEAEQTYCDIYNRRILEEDPRAPLQFLSVRMAELYLKHHRYAQAASVVSDAPAQLQEFIENGWKYTLPRTTPLSMLGIVWRLRVLAQALAGQEEHHLADSTFQLCLEAAGNYLPENDAVRMQAQKAYSKYLLSQNRFAEVSEIEKMLDLQLALYKLTV